MYLRDTAASPCSKDSIGGTDPRPGRFPIAGGTWLTASSPQAITAVYCGCGRMRSSTRIP